MKSDFQGLLGVLVFASCVSAFGASYTEVPVIINIHTNAGTTVEEATNAVRRASQILRQAGFRLTVVEVNPNFSGHGVDPNGDFDEKVDNDSGGANTRKLIDKANDDLTANTNANGKGIKIFFVRRPLTNYSDGSSLLTGWSIHREPVVVVRNRGDTNSTGQTIAHEFGHITTLAVPNFVIGSEAGTNVTGTQIGHAPNIPGTNGVENLMAPSNYRTNTILTTNQIVEMGREATNRGHKVVIRRVSDEVSYLVPLQRGRGYFGYPLEPSHPAAFYAHALLLNSADGQMQLSGEVHLPAVLPPDRGVTFCLGFDSDDNPETGNQYGPFQGMDFAVELRITWPPGANEPDLVTTARDLHEFTNSVVSPSPQLTTELRAGDLKDFEAVVGAQTVHFSVDKALVGLPLIAPPEGSGLVRVGLWTEDHETGTVIENGPAFYFDLKEWSKGAQMQIAFADEATRTLKYDVTGLPSNQGYTLYLDEFVIGSGTTSDAGTNSGSFQLPLSFSGAIPHFLTAQVESGAFAFTMTLVSQPRLGIAQLGDSAMRIRWEKSVRPYLLQTTSSLSLGGWALVSQQPVDEGEHLHIDIEAGTGTQFFRLFPQQN